VALRNSNTVTRLCSSVK